jgi:toxin-antitoxin system PIN domain toxin
LESVVSGGEDVGLALVTVLAFLRLSTDGRLYEQPRSPAGALAIVETLLSLPTIHLLEPTERHWLTLGRVAEEGRARGPGMMDAHLAALTLERGAALATADRGFRRFPGLRTIDPTVA